MYDIMIIQKLKDLALSLAKTEEANVQIVLDINPVEDSVKCKITEFNL